MSQLVLAVFSFLSTSGPTGVAALQPPAAVPALRGGLEKHEECRVHLHNDADVDVTLKLDVDGQNVKIIPDTGSFAAVFFSDDCESCGARRSLLHTRSRHHLKTGEHRAVQAYGSGQTYSVEAWAPASLECRIDGTADASQLTHLTTAKQMFWMTVKANLPVAADSTFQGILGMGPPRSDARVAAMEAQAAAQQVDQMRAAGMDVTRYEPVVAGLQSVAKFTKTVKPFLKDKGIVTYSFCIGKRPGADGVLTFNDPTPDTMASAFIKITVESNGIYWQTDLSDLSLGSDEDAGRIRTNGATKAILDTGTSLIGAPEWFVASVVAFVQEHIEEFGCEDTSLWPPLTFKLNGQQFSLPGSSYVGKMEQDATEDALADHRHVFVRMPHLMQTAQCTAMIFSTQQGDAQVEGAELGRAADSSADPDDDAEVSDWIFGLPFFKAYYTAFRLSEDSLAPRHVYVATADENCYPVTPQAKALRTPMPEAVPPVVIRPSKLRLPSRRMPKNGKEVVARHFEQGSAQV